MELQEIATTLNNLEDTAIASCISYCSKLEGERKKDFIKTYGEDVYEALINLVVKVTSR